MDPFRERRAFYEARMPLVKEALHEGSARAQKLARETIEMVRDALDLGYAERT